ncbi:MAG: DMT family transporter [Emcibacter sp.]|nr:DMT family transporter [Emcibacter sp.]
MNETSSNNLLGIGFILLSCMTITISALLIRTIGKNLNPFEVVFIRCSFSLLYILILQARHGKKIFVSPRPVLLTARSLILSILVLGNFYAIVHLPLVQVTALQFTKPLFLVVLAALFLSEKIRLPRTMATLLGFIGILVILRPDGDIQPAQVIVLVAAISTAILTVITKKMTRDHATNTLVFYGNLFIVLLCLAPTIYYWQAPSLMQWVMIAGLGLSAYGGQVCMVQAYRYGEATAISPFEYIRIIFIALAGFIIFDEIPDNWTIVGAVIICGSTLFIALRAARKKRQALAV